VLGLRITNGQQITMDDGYKSEEEPTEGLFKCQPTSHRGSLIEVPFISRSERIDGAYKYAWLCGKKKCCIL